jgi:two-component SAPR family response regulator
MFFGGEIESTRLAATIFPDDLPGDAVKAIRVWISRLRAKFRGRDVILSTPAGYRAAAHISFDFAVAEQAVSRMECGESLSALEMESLRRFALSRANAMSLILADAEWAAPLLRRAEESRRQALLAIAKHAFEAKDFAEAQRLARMVLDDDPVDEAAVELKLRSHVAAGATLEAQRLYRRYESALQAEVGTAPSDHLAALLDRP